MASYDIAFKPSVEKDLRSLPKSTVSRVMEHIENLKVNPLPRQAAKVMHSPPVQAILDKFCVPHYWDRLDDGAFPSRHPVYGGVRTCTQGLTTKALLRLSPISGRVRTPGLSRETPAETGGPRKVRPPRVSQSPNLW